MVSDADIANITDNGDDDKWVDDEAGESGCQA